MTDITAMVAPFFQQLSAPVLMQAVHSLAIPLDIPNMPSELKQFPPELILPALRAAWDTLRLLSNASGCATILVYEKMGWKLPFQDFDL